MNDDATAGSDDHLRRQVFEESKRRIEEAGLEVMFVKDRNRDPHPWPRPPGKDHPRCIGCLGHPADQSVYVELAEELRLSAAEYVVRNEGTFDPESGWYLCDPCYIRAGQPSSATGWRATPENCLALMDLVPL